MRSATWAPREALHPPVDAATATRWMGMFPAGTAVFPTLLGITVEAVRTDYARMRLPFRPDLLQPQGVVHGGAIAALVDTVVVPAIGSAYPEPRPFSTVDLNIRYLNPVRNADLIAEGWITRRGRSIVFCDAEVATLGDDGEVTVVAQATLTYKVSSPRPAPVPDPTDPTDAPDVPGSDPQDG